MSVNTKVAIAFYYLSVGSVVFCGDVIAVKLIFWPPCTQIGHDCVVDGWSVAGLAATVLAVAATVLAVLGAVAVAAWWTSLNDRVADQVTKLYNEQIAETNKRVDYLLGTLEARVHVQLEEFQKSFDKLQAEIDKLRGEVREVNSFTTNMIEKAYDMDGNILKVLSSVVQHLPSDNPPTTTEQKQDNLPVPLEAAQLADTTTPTASEN